MLGFIFVFVTIQEAWTTVQEMEYYFSKNQLY